VWLTTEMVFLKKWWILHPSIVSKMLWTNTGRKWTLKSIELDCSLS
jgi:hypothetical protein